MDRRQFLALGGAAGAALGSAGLDGFAPPESEPDIRLRIAPLTLELGPRRRVATVAYNGQVPGPLLRVAEGKSITVQVENETGWDELVHWHGLHIPSEVDGAHEEGTPHVPRKGRRRYTFTPRPAGTRWYHSHGHAGRNLNRSTYSGQFGVMIIEPAGDPGSYDLDVPIVLHEWEPYLTEQGGLDVEYKIYSINGKMLGAGEPVRVRPSQRVLFRFVNASATLTHRLALAGHTFRVISMDGNSLPDPRVTPVVEVGPGERIDAIVAMSNPGVWILGSALAAQRDAGLGIVVEYAGATSAARWLSPPAFAWDYADFGREAGGPEPDETIPLVFRPVSPQSHRWTINGKSFPNTAPIKVREGRRYRLLFDNQSAHAHPMHLHRHTFEVTRFLDRKMSGVFKDVVVVPAWKQVEVDLIATNPGLSLFHCHQQFHMDAGFMALMEYA